MSEGRISSETVVSSQVSAPEAFVEQICDTLKETEQAVLGFVGISSESAEARSWETARSITAEFRPVPWVIWRLSNYVLGKQGRINTPPEGLLLGLRKIILAAAGDPVLGKGSKVTQVPIALGIVPPDVLAAVSVIHAVSRRLASKGGERVWRPILDDAIVRAQIGFRVGGLKKEFGRGRAMLAGFAGRIGLAILLASGSQEQTQRALEKLSSGGDTASVGMEVFGCNPLQVSAMVLSASGCGRDAAFGTVSYAMSKPGCVLESEVQAQWLAAFTIAEHIRMSRPNLIDEDSWEFLGFLSDQPRRELEESSKLAIRRGHGWVWIL